MTYFKIVSGGYIVSIGSYDGELNSPVAAIITKAQHDEIATIYASKPAATETTDYRLREDLTWEEYPVDPPDPDPDMDDAEAFQYLFGGDT